MNVEMITREDLQNLKTEIIAEIKAVFSKERPAENNWLRSAQVRKMLSISPGTLQNLRVHGHLRFTRIGGSFFYNLRDILTMLEKNAAKK